MKWLFNRLFCRHNYIKKYFWVAGTDTGWPKDHYLNQCEKCGKINTNLREPFLSELMAKRLKNDHLIQCTIETPQFRGSQDNYWMKRQTGFFDSKTLLFTPNDNPDNDKGEVGKHSVQFHSLSDFKKSRIK